MKPEFASTEISTVRPFTGRFVLLVLLEILSLTDCECFLFGRASSHPATMHRALYIVHPTTELSGEYKCFVSTFTDEDFMIKKMIVYGEKNHC